MMEFLLYQWERLKENFLFMSLIFVFLSISLFLIFYILKVPEVFYSIPLALISVAAFSIYEAKEYRNMLRNTMSEIVQDINYLRLLKREKLDDILNKFHQVYYGLPETVDVDNLYNFIKKNILDKYIGEAYIEGLDTTWEFHNIPGEKYYRITKTTDFKIIAVKDKETKGTIPIGVAVSPIMDMPLKDHFPLNDWSVETANSKAENWKHEDIRSCVVQENYSCHYYLEYNVTKDMPIRVKYTIVAYESTDDRTAHQIFELPTHKLKLTIIVHDFQDTKFNSKFAGIPPSKPDRDEKISKTQYKIEFGGWMIPGNSITVTF